MGKQGVALAWTGCSRGRCNWRLGGGALVFLGGRDNEAAEAALGGAAADAETGQHFVYRLCGGGRGLWGRRRRRGCNRSGMYIICKPIIMRLLRVKCSVKLLFNLFQNGTV